MEYPGSVLLGLVFLLSAGSLVDWNCVDANPRDLVDLTQVNYDVDILFTTELECSPSVAEGVKGCVRAAAGSLSYWDVCNFKKNASGCYTEGFDACKLDPRAKDDFLKGYNGGSGSGSGFSSSQECLTESKSGFRTNAFLWAFFGIGILVAVTIAIVSHRRCSRLTNSEKEVRTKLLEPFQQTEL